MPKEALFGAMRLEIGVLEDRLYSLLERVRFASQSAAALASARAAQQRLSALRASAPQDGSGVVCLEDVLRTLAAAAAGETLRVTRRLRRGSVDIALPPLPLPASAWEVNDGSGRSDSLRSNFAFELCVAPQTTPSVKAAHR